MPNPPLSVNLRYFALLREQRGIEHETMTTTASTLGELYAELAQLYNFTLPPNRMAAAVNDCFRPMTAKITEGDKITFIPPVAGG